MTRACLKTPSRLHFGLLSWGGAARQFGGVGLMIEAPGLELHAGPADSWMAEPPLAGRVLEFAKRVADRLEARGLDPIALAFRIDHAPREHAGLGLGTQLGLGVARVVCELAGYHDPTVFDLAELSGRGLRSGIGLHGFVHGGLIVDGGRVAHDSPPPLLSRLEFPPDWSILVVIPPSSTGIHGSTEVQAFADLPPSPEALTDRLCRLVLLGLLPSVVEADLGRFGESLEAIQQLVGQGFAPAQGGLYARPEIASIAAEMRQLGLAGVGQSSWGPTLYGFHDGSPAERRQIIESLSDRFSLDPDAAFWTRASPQGATFRLES